MTQVVLSGELTYLDDEIVASVCEDIARQIRAAEDDRRSSKRRRFVSRIRPETVHLKPIIGSPHLPVQLEFGAEWKLDRSAGRTSAEPWEIPDSPEDRLKWLLDKLPPSDPLTPPTHNANWSGWWKGLPAVVQFQAKVRPFIWGASEEITRIASLPPGEESIWTSSSDEINEPLRQHVRDQYSAADPSYMPVASDLPDDGGLHLVLVSWITPECFGPDMVGALINNASRTIIGFRSDLTRIWGAGPDRQDKLLPYGFEYPASLRSSVHGAPPRSYPLIEWPSRLNDDAADITVLAIYRAWGDPT